MVWCEAALALVTVLVLAMLGVYVRPWLDAHGYRILLGTLLALAVALLGWLWRRYRQSGGLIGSAWKSRMVRLGGGVVIAVLVTLLFNLGLTGVRGPRLIPLELFHWVLFGLFGAYFARRLQGPLVAMASLGLALVIAVADEWLQALMLERVGDIRDVFLDVIAWILGVWVAIPERPRYRVRPRLPLAYVALWVATLLALWVGTDWLVGLYRQPYPAQQPVLTVPSRWPTMGPDRVTRVRNLWGLRFGGAWLHEKERWFAWKQKAPPDCAPWYELAFRVLYENGRADPTALPEPKHNCVPVDVRLLHMAWWGLALGWLVAGLAIGSRFPPRETRTGQ